jgi:hypothetical protein
MAEDPGIYQEAARQEGRLTKYRTGPVTDQTNQGSEMDAKMLKKLADQFDELSATVIAIGGTFRAAAGGGKGGGVDEEASGKPAAKPASKRTVKKAETEEDEVTVDTVRDKLRELVDAKGKDKMVEALESVGAGKLADVDESQYQELLDKAQELIDAEEEPEEPKKGKPAAKKGKKVKDLVDLDTLKEKAADIDKDTLRGILKKFKAKNLSALDEDQYEDFLAAMEAAEDGEDDDLVG